MKNLKNILSVAVVMMTLTFTSCSSDDQSITELEDFNQGQTNNVDVEVDEKAATFLDYQVREWALHRTPGPFNMGHSGVAFEVITYRGNQEVARRFHYGAVENSGGSFSVPAGNEGNEGWYATTTSEQVMLDFFKNVYGYNSYRYSTYGKVSKSTIDRAIGIMENFRTRGYNAVGNNCLNAAWDVLNALPVLSEPRPVFNITPNSWINNFTAIKGWSARTNF